MFKKKYKCTSKIRYGFIKESAMNNLGEAYIKADKHNRAVDCFNRLEDLKTKAWENVYELYPHLKGKSISYNRYDNMIIVNK